MALYIHSKRNVTYMGGDLGGDGPLNLRWRGRSHFYPSQLPNISYLFNKININVKILPLLSRNRKNSKVGRVLKCCHYTKEIQTNYVGSE